MNVINLKNISLSVVMASTMISGVCARESVEEGSQITSVTAARARFKQFSETPEKLSPSVSFEKDFAKAREEGRTVQGLRTEEFLEDKVVKTQVDAKAGGEAKDFLDLGNEARSSQREEKRDLKEAEKVLNTLKDEKETSLANLKAEVENFQKETQDFQDQVLLTKSGIRKDINKVVAYVDPRNLTNPVGYVW